MSLLNRGRLSVQPLEEKTWGIVELLAERGGWDDLNTKPTKGSGQKVTAKKPSGRKPKAKSSKRDVDAEASANEAGSEEEPSAPVKSKGRKRKAAETEETDNARATRRSTRLKT